MLIYEERRKMNETLVKDKEHLLLRFNELMSHRGDKSKDDLMKELFKGDNTKAMKNNKSSINFKSANFSKIHKLEDEKDDNNDKQKEDNFFVTNMVK